MCPLVDNTALLGLGSNSHAEMNILGGIFHIMRQWTVVALSSIYRTEPVGEGAGSKQYLNCCVRLECAESEDTLKRQLQRIEELHGHRIRSQLEPVRPLDCDILAFHSVGQLGELRHNPALEAFIPALNEFGITGQLGVVGSDVLDSVVRGTSTAIAVWTRNNCLVSSD